MKLDHRGGLKAIYPISRAIPGAASLKLCHVRTRGDDAGDFRAIPGAASLKPSSCATFSRRRRHFRAIPGAASLKLHLAPHIGLRRTSFPRHPRRGLIEAYYFAMRAPKFDIISAPSQARPH